MPATVLLNEYNGIAAVTVTNKTAGVVRMKNADDSTVDSLDPLQKPGAGFTYSFIKYLRLAITVVPTGTITNLQFYTSGGTGTGTEVGIRTVNAAYSTPIVGDVTSYGLTTDATTYTTGARKNMNVFVPGPFTLVGPIGDYASLIMRIGTTATAPGTTTPLALSFSYDET